MGRFSGYFEGASAFLTPKFSLATLWTIWGQKSFGPLKISLQIANKVIYPQKYNLPHFKNHRYINSYNIQVFV
jgi:hypothetical protein